MWMNFISKISEIEEKYGDSVNSGVPNTVFSALMKKNNVWPNDEVMEDYKRFLSQVNGIDFNVFILYGISQKTNPDIIDEDVYDIFEMNIIWHEESSNNSYFFLGESGMSWYVYDTFDRVYKELDLPSGDLVNKYSTLDDLLESVLKTALNQHQQLTLEKWGSKVDRILAKGDDVIKRFTKNLLKKELPFSVGSEVLAGVGRVGHQPIVGEVIQYFKDKARDVYSKLSSSRGGFSWTLRGENVEIPNISLKEIEYAKRAREEYQKLRREFDLTVRKEFLKDISEKFSVGDEVEAIVTELNEKKKSIILSVKKIQEIEESKEMEELMKKYGV